MPGIIYNVTIKVSQDIHLEWVEWMKKEHIPEVMATACFTAFRFLHLEGYDDDEGITYAIQYTCPNQTLFDIYHTDHAPALQQKHQQKYEGRYAAFRTQLTIVDEG